MPSSPTIQSALPWSAVIITAPPISVAAFTTLPTHSSTDSTALTAALALRADTLRLHSALFVVLSYTNIAKREKAILPFKAVKRRVIILSPESSNPRYKPKAYKEVRIQGIVTHVIKCVHTN